MWQTLEEFKANNPVEGWCWIWHINELHVFMSYFDGDSFYTDNDDFDSWYEEEDISNVMPLTPPDAPK